MKTKPVSKCERMPRQFCRKEDCENIHRSSTVNILDQELCYYRIQRVSKVNPYFPSFSWSVFRKLSLSLSFVLFVLLYKGFECYAMKFHFSQIYSSAKSIYSIQYPLSNHILLLSLLFLLYTGFETNMRIFHFRQIYSFAQNLY